MPPATLAAPHPLLVFERASDELRRGQPIIISDGAQHYRLCLVEYVDNAVFASLSASHSLVLVLCGARARSLKLSGDARPWVVNAANLSLAQLRALADPLADQITVPPLSHIAPEKLHEATLQLVKNAGTLPAFLLCTAEASEGSPAFPLSALLEALAVHDVEMVPTAQATLPISAHENTHIVSYRQRYTSNVHLALLIGKAMEVDIPLVRLHSSCVTGDILGSLRCDCGSQLKAATSQMADTGQGILLYLHQEGRDIGITNKIRAYALQERGIDTYDANMMLGFEEDERDFAIAAAMLKQMGKTTIALLTNNPDKIAKLQQHGITVAQRLPVVCAANTHNKDYLDSKAKKAGHLF